MDRCRRLLAGFQGVTTGLAGRTTWLTRVWPDNPLTMGNLVRDLPAEPVEVDWVSGACMMVRRDAFAAVGGMDEQFFLYWEDADLCRRLKQAGWKTYYQPGVTVTHLTGQSSQHARKASLVAFHAERLPVLPEARESAARAVRISGAAGQAATEAGDASVGRQCPVAPPCRQLITNVGVVM